MKEKVVNKFLDLEIELIQLQLRLYSEEHNPNKDLISYTLKRVEEIKNSFSTLYI
jgi:hypothetical protein